MRSAIVVILVLALATFAGAQKKDWVEPVPVEGRALDCTNAIPIYCGDVLTGDNTGMPNNVVNYSCVGYNENGGEVVYEFTIPAGMCLDLLITMEPSGCDLDLFFLGSCDETDCLYYSGSTGTETIVTGCLEPGTYYDYYVVAVNGDGLESQPSASASARTFDGTGPTTPADLTAVAVGTDRGLVVPVVRHAAARSFAQVEGTIGELAKKARAGSLTMEELQGGSFTIQGQGFGASQGMVTLDDMLLTVNSWSDTSIDVAVEAGTPRGRYQLKITSAAGESTINRYQPPTNAAGSTARQRAPGGGVTGPARRMAPDGVRWPPCPRTGRTFRPRGSARSARLRPLRA